MGVPFVHPGQQVHPEGHLTGTDTHRRSKESRTADFIQRNSSEESNDSWSVDRKADGHFFLGLVRCYLRKQFVDEQNGHRALPCLIIGLYRHLIAEKRPYLAKKSTFPAWKRIGSHLRRHHGELGRIRLRTCHFLLFPESRKFTKSLVRQKFELNEQVIAMEPYFQKARFFETGWRS